jgi:uncharacterized protein (DUF58 family)
MPRTAPEIHYRIAGAARGIFPGHHRSRSGESGFEFRGHAALHDAPDARRLDLHASLRDPFGGWVVRRYSERKSIAVAMVADLSASMGFDGSDSGAGNPEAEGLDADGPKAGQRKLDVLADFAQCLAWSAWRTGDSFGFVACDEAVRTDLGVAATRRRGAGLAIASALRRLQPQGRSARGLLDAHRHLPARRALVFLVSDFHLPLTEVEAVLASLALHDVVPVVLWQPVEFELGATRGLALVQEPESGVHRWLWWRPALRDRWRAAHQARREALLATFRAHRLAPLFIEGRFDADAVTRHFLA